MNIADAAIRLGRFALQFDVGIVLLGKAVIEDDMLLEFVLLGEKLEAPTVGFAVVATVVTTVVE